MISWRMINIITDTSSIMGSRKSEAGIIDELRANATPREAPKERFSPLPRRRIKTTQSECF